MSDKQPTKTFQQWLAAQNHVQPSRLTDDRHPSTYSAAEGLWSVPIISWGNDRFSWAQKIDGTGLVLQHHETTGTFRIITDEEGKISYFAREDPSLKLVGAVTLVLNEDSPVVRLIFVNNREAKTDFRNVKLPSAAHAEALVEHFVQMRSIPVVQRPQSDLALKQGLEVILHDLAKEWEKAMPDESGSDKQKAENL
ncbi:MAG: hypothetical protein LQ350_003315 [Teloschistes chrysophthalmus]|nr:MAG: hypothetical protein LQ350_003315 [Niorma chrysophthalma]